MEKRARTTPTTKTPIRLVMRNNRAFLVRVFRLAAANFDTILWFSTRNTYSELVWLGFGSVWLRLRDSISTFFARCEYQQCDRYGVSDTIAVRLCLVRILMCDGTVSAAMRHFLTRLRCFFVLKCTGDVLHEHESNERQHLLRWDRNCYKCLLDFFIYEKYFFQWKILLLFVF